MKQSHKDAISKSMKGRKPSKQAMEALKNRFSEFHHNRLRWYIIDPTGVMHQTTSMQRFCQTHGISYASMKAKAAHDDIRPVARGSAQGWSVFARKVAQVEKQTDHEFVLQLDQDDSD